MEDTVLVCSRNKKPSYTQANQRHSTAVQGAQSHAYLKPRHPLIVSFQFRCKKECLDDDAIGANRSEEDESSAAHDTECVGLGHSEAVQHIFQDAVAQHVSVDPEECVYQKH